MDLAVRKLELRASLSEDEKRDFLRAFPDVRSIRRDQDVLHEGERTGFIICVLEGLLCRHKALPARERQIVGLTIPGDIFDLNSLLLDRADYGITALSDCRVALARHSSIKELAERRPRLAAALWAETAAEARLLREWVVNCGRRNSYARTAHLLCELFARMNDIGLAQNGECRLPMTQVDLADTLGISLVHVNRVLQQLRTRGLASMNRGRLIVYDWEGLSAAGCFSGEYLQTGNQLGLNNVPPLAHLTAAGPDASNFQR